jgi:membrane-bound lytic murein transglycosylase D
VPGKHERIVFFTATRASTPTSIAAAFAVPWAKIVGWNDLDPRARVQPGQVLQIVVPREWTASSKDVVVHERDDVDLVQRGSKEHLEAALARRGKQRRAVKAKKGDTLAKVGKRFDLTDGDLARINGYARDHELAPGEVVVVYVDDADTRGTIEAPPPRVSAGRDDALAGRDAAVSGRDADARDVDEPARASAGAEPRASKSATPRVRRRSRSASTPSTSRLPGGRGAPP